jgi:serine/threonine-protein kinase
MAKNTILLRVILTQPNQKKLGRYCIDYEIGSGGLGRVFRGTDSYTGKTVAIKFLHEKYQKNKRFLGIFHRELMIIARLKHKHIVQFIDANYEEDNCYIVTEFVDGWSLHKLMKQIHIFPPLVALTIAIDILQGIDYLHLHDMIHSDLSSPNVLVAKNGRVLLADFGLACSGELENYKNYMIGTPGYYSPEHISNTSMQVQSDIYCVGLLLYEMLTGEKAVVAAKDSAQVIASMKKVNVKKISSPDSRLQSSLRTIVSNALKFKMTRRTATAEEMMLQILKVLKNYNIRYARHAIHQFLGESGLSLPIPEKFHQNIHSGSPVKTFFSHQ